MLGDYTPYPTLLTYNNFISSEHINKPNFTTMVAALAQPVENLMTQLQNITFDLDTSTGDALDKIGAFVGFGRNVPVNASTLFFQWDTYNQGWDQGIWYDPTYASSQSLTLDDNSYRACLYMKIICNYSNCTTYSIRKILKQLPNCPVVFNIVDRQNMTCDVYLYTSSVNNLVMSVISQGGLLPIPMGVAVNYYYIQAGTAPMFTLDSPTAGLDTGAFPNVTLGQ
jgi:hypothetical protein